MWSVNSLENLLLNNPLLYSDEETGISWTVEVFEIYRDAFFDETILVLTDNIKVKLSPFDLIKGPEGILKTIDKQYQKAINNLEYSNG